MEASLWPPRLGADARPLAQHRPSRGFLDNWPGIPTFQPCAGRLSQCNLPLLGSPHSLSNPGKKSRPRAVPGPRSSNGNRTTDRARHRRHARHEGVGPAAFRHRQRHGGSGLFQGRRPRAGRRSGLPLRPPDHAGDPGRLRPQPPRDRLRLSRHRQVDPHRAGRGAAQLALRARQPRQPHQPYRPDRQGRHRHQGRQAGHRIPRRHPALGLPATTSRCASTNTTPAART